MRRVLLCVVPIVAVGAAVVTWLALPLSRPAGPTGGANPRAMVDRTGRAPLDATTIAIAAERGARSVAPGLRGALRQAITDTLTVWTSGSVEDWLVYLDAYGIEHPNSAQTMPDSMRRQWERAQTLLATSQLEGDRAAAVDAFSNPAVDEWGGTNEPTNVAIHKARRDQARAFLRDIPEERRQVVRMTIPGVFLGADQQEYQAELRLEFTRNPHSGQWVLTEVGMKGDDGVPAPVILML